MKPHKHWDERVSSDLSEVFHEKLKFFVKLVIKN